MLTIMQLKFIIQQIYFPFNNASYATVILCAIKFIDQTASLDIWLHDFSFASIYL